MHEAQFTWHQEVKETALTAYSNDVTRKTVNHG